MRKKNKNFFEEDDFSVVTDIVPLKEEKKEKKSAKGLFACIGVIILTALLCAFLFIDSGPVGAYKKNFKTNISYISSSLGLDEIFNSSDFEKVDVDISDAEVNVTLGSTFEQSSKMLPFENASLSKYAVGNRGLTVAKSNYLAIFDKDGNTVWETHTSVIEPILKVKGEYTLLVEKNGTRICLYRDEEIIYSVDDENQIISAEVSANGDVVLVTKKEFYKNAVSVYNKNGEKIFSWGSGTDTIINADISGSTRRIAVSLINTDDRVKSYVMLFDINQTEAYHTLEFTESVVYKTEFVGETLNLAADNRLTGVKVNGNVDWDNVFEEGELILFAIDGDGNKAAVTDKNNIPEFVIYNRKGDEKEKIKLVSIPDYIDVQNKSLIYNSERIVRFGEEGKLKQYIASMDIKGLKIINKDAFVIVYNNSLEFVNAK